MRTMLPLHISPPPQPLKTLLNFCATACHKGYRLMFNSGEKESTRDLLQMEAITGAVIK